MHDVLIRRVFVQQVSRDPACVVTGHPHETPAENVLIRLQASLMTFERKWTQGTDGVAAN